MFAPGRFAAGEPLIRTGRSGGLDNGSPTGGRATSAPALAPACDRRARAPRRRPAARPRARALPAEIHVDTWRARSLPVGLGPRRAGSEWSRWRAPRRPGWKRRRCGRVLRRVASPSDFARALPDWIWAGWPRWARARPAGAVRVASGSEREGKSHPRQLAWGVVLCGAEQPSLVVGAAPFGEAKGGAESAVEALGGRVDEELMSPPGR